MTASPEEPGELVGQMGYVIGEFTDEIEDAPTLGEVLEILAFSIPNAIIELPESPKLQAILADGQIYANMASRVAGLNDEAFVEAVEFWAALSRKVGANSLDVLVPHLTSVLASPLLAYSDVSAADIRRIELSHD